MTDPLPYIWELFDSPHLLLSHAELRRWPQDVVAALMRLGFLCEAANVDHAGCPSCADRHVEEVLCRPDADGGMRFFIPCPEALRVEIAVDELRRWSIDIDAVAHAIAAALPTQARCTVRVASRLWRLGALPQGGVRRDVLLLRGAGWPDAGDVLQRVGDNGRAIVLIAGMPPAQVAWPGLPATLVPLPQVCALVRNTIKLSSPEILALVQDTDAANQVRRPVALSRKQQKREFQKAAGDVLKAKLGDDRCVQAYRQHGSYRKAATALTDELGFTITKDQVSRAVQRAGGVAAVKLTDDTDSIQRTVASRRCDRQRKFASPTQPPQLE